MRLRLFGFPDESPHAILGPDDFCITRMMRPGLMELRVSGGISLYSLRLVDKTWLCPLTQSTAKLLTQQSWEKQRERGKKQCYKGNKYVGENQSEKIKMHMHLQCEKRHGKREEKINTEPLTFLHVIQITGNGFKGFFPVRFTLIPPLSLHLTELMSRSSQTSEY